MELEDLKKKAVENLPQQFPALYYGYPQGEFSKRLESFLLIKIAEAYASGQTALRERLVEKIQNFIKNGVGEQAKILLEATLSLLQTSVEEK